MPVVCQIWVEYPNPRNYSVVGLRHEERIYEVKDNFKMLIGHATWDRNQLMRKCFKDGLFSSED